MSDPATTKPPAAGPTWVIGITGASGLVYAYRLLEVLLEQTTLQLHVLVSNSAWRVAQDELTLSGESLESSLKQLLEHKSGRVTLHNNRDIGASIASGSFRTSGMVIVPCSMKTLAAVAHGLSENLLQRAADVILKERRQLIVVPRETPLSAIHLENMLKLSQLGVQVVPAMPGFYHKPQTLSDLVEMMVMRIADQMGLSIDLVPRWGKESQER